MTDNKEEGTWKELREKWSRVGKVATGVREATLEKAGRLVVSDKALKKAFRGPLTSPVSEEELQRRAQEAKEARETIRLREEREKQEAIKKEQESREKIGRLGLLPPGTPVEEARRRPEERIPTGGPPAPPEGEGGRRPEEREPGEITGKVVNSDNNKDIEGAQVGAYAAPQGFYDITQTDDKGSYILNAPSGRRYRLQATASGYRTTSIISPHVEAGKSVTADTIKMKLEKRELRGMKRFKRGVPLFNWDWLTGEGDYKGQNGFIRIGLALILTALLFFLFYKPFFDAINLHHVILDWIIPWIITPFLMFFIVTPKFTDDPKWGSLIFAGIAAFGLLILIAWTAPPFLKEKFFSTSYFWAGSWLAIFLFVLNASPKEKQGMVKTLLTYGGILLILGTLFLIWNLIASGDAFKIETYIKTLDVLKLVGVSENTVESMKDGIRNTLSFLSFKGAEQTKPEAKKIGGFEAIELKFGSRHNSFLLPTMFARMEYTLPVTVTNPNKFDTKLVVEDFTIDNVFVNNRSNRMFCGGVNETQTVNGKIRLNNINPEEEKSTTIEFKDKTNCLPVVATFSTVQNPMYPARFAIPYENPPGEQKDKTEDCKLVCTNATKGRAVVNEHNARYGVVDVLDVDGSRYLSGTSQCECKVNRHYNVMDELCFFDGNKAQISLKSNYGFKVQGKGELVLVKVEADKKLAPKPSITSSAGPLTVTTYFVSDIHAFEGGSKTKNMFIEIKNEGKGTAKLTGLSINGFDISKLGSGISPISLVEGGKVSISSCSPDPKVLSVSEEAVTVICSLAPQDSSVVSGSYRTLPVIVDVNYTYTQTHSTSVGIKKENIPEGVTEIEQIIELDNQFKLLPYYCPNVNAPGITPPLKIYDTSVVSTQSQTTQTTTQPPTPTPTP